LAAATSSKVLGRSPGGGGGGFGGLGGGGFGGRDIRLFPLSHHQALTLLAVELEFRDGGSFGRLLIWRVHISDVLSARSQDRDAPRPKRGA
jgi:hypothetical protein